MRSSWRLGVLLFVGAVLPNVAAAQWSRVAGLPAGSEIRIATSGGKTLRGFLQSGTEDALVINATTSQETVARQDVKRVHLKKPGHRGRNTLIGLGIGMGGGLAAGAVVDSRTRDNWFPNAGKAIFTAVGAIVGTVVGVAIPTGGWREVYRAP